MRGLIVCLLCLASATRLAAADEARDQAKQQLAPLQDFVGQWKGVGQRERGKRAGSWIENSTWAWKFDDDSAAIAFASTDARYASSGAITPTKNQGEYQLTLTAADGRTTVTYVGKLADEQLVLQADKPVEGLPGRISLRLVAGGKRLVALYEVASTGDRYTRLAEVGYTRVGSGFGQGAQGPECIVTGGFGSIEVTHQGKTYHVCCTGCKEYFDDDPQRAIAEYEERRKQK